MKIEKNEISSSLNGVTTIGERRPAWVELASTLSNVACCLATQLQRHLCCYSKTSTSTLQTVIDQKLSLERGLFCRKSRVLFALNHCSEQCPEKSTSRCRCRRRFVSKVYFCLPASLTVDFLLTCAFFHLPA
ncbi:hypothetical protein T10_1484 [Trichinella papuae]|uniref:Uncharacterized protein n=1 Tax=Trichinella papuae TaxID=268474 RepID=A0A0V1MGZ5_9BILA|nr:hypothetical protein T10_1484 [Trichinella papuae]